MGSSHQVSNLMVPLGLRPSRDSQALGLFWIPPARTLVSQGAFPDTISHLNYCLGYLIQPDCQCTGVMWCGLPPNPVIGNI